MKGCMNCGNISCGNNKKRESAGCGRWKDPEETEKEYKQYEAIISAAQKNFKELEEDYNSKDELFKKIEELQAQIEKMKCCYNCSKWNDGECEESPKSKTFFCADFKCESWECIK